MAAFGRAARFTLGVITLLLAACAPFAPGNPSLDKYDPHTGYRFEGLDHAGNTDRLFVIVTFSGGGTRAAALAYGVLEALRDTTIELEGEQVSLLDEVSVLRMMNNHAIDKLVVVVVNAATNPETDRDQTPSVPGLVDTLTAAATVPLDNYSFDTVELLGAKVDAFNEEARLIGGCQKLAAKKGEECALDIPAPHQVDLYPVQVAFEYIEDPDERTWFRNLPTTFELPRDTVDKLRAVGRRLLAEDPGFQELMEALNGQLAASRRDHAG